MIDFEYLAPTKIYFGKDKENDVGSIINNYGFKRILLHYGGGSIKKSGLYDRVVASLKKANIEFVELGGVLPNPDVSLVRKGVALCKENQIEMILAVGGGSVIDSSKLMSHAVYYSGDPYDISLKKYTSTKHLPVGVILTIAAAGSEMSNSCVISNREIEKKKGFNTDLNRPLFAIENPELTYSVSSYQTACGITDIISHTFERYFNKSEEIEFADYLAEGLIKSVMESGRKAINNPNDYNARANLMLASSYSHNGLTNLGKLGMMPIHQLEHELSARYPGVAHGAGLAVLTPAWMECVYPYDKAKFVKYARNVLSINEELDDDALVEKAIQMMKDFYRKIGMPSSLKEFGVKEEDIELMANRLTNNGATFFASNVPLTKELAVQIYKKCF